MTYRAAPLLGAEGALIGTTEHPPGSNHTVVGAFYGVQDEWCAMTVTMA